MREHPHIQSFFRRADTDKARSVRERSFMGRTSSLRQEACEQYKGYHNEARYFTTVWNHRHKSNIVTGNQDRWAERSREIRWSYGSTYHKLSSSISRWFASASRGVTQASIPTQRSYGTGSIGTKYGRVTEACNRQKSINAPDEKNSRITTSIREATVGHNEAGSSYTFTHKATSIASACRVTCTNDGVRKQ